MINIVLLGALLALTSGAAVPPELDLDGRIVGGEPADIVDYPHQISLQYYGYHICGGTILSEKFIVTAAHCTFDKTATSFTIRVGSSKNNQYGQVIKVVKKYEHPKYARLTKNYDVTVMELDYPILFDDSASPIPLAQTEPIADSECTCTGWGATENGGHSIEDLQQVHLQILDRKVCYDKYVNFNLITPQMICTTDGQQKDACQGDSGGPLIQNGELIGIVSWGKGCAQKNAPGVFANVAVLRDFIESVTKM